VFVAALILLFSPLGDLAYIGVIAYTLAMIGSVICAAITKFAMPPALERERILLSPLPQTY
jgi:hypothetical protein